MVKIEYITKQTNCTYTVANNAVLLQAVWFFLPLNLEALGTITYLHSPDNQAV